ncbi:MAG: SDR family NAD(P)-dependent oxidoreductase [Lachnospiraceae bacterium]|nr:SDR family NAD(P)-dependent oxidoreductase [Lachnospiraceae bacterium]
MNIAIITGASSGMGRESARQLDKIYTDGIDEIWLVARRKARLEELAAELNHRTRIFPLDLTDDKCIQEFDLTLNLVNPNVKFLVNASGFGVMGKFSAVYAKEHGEVIRLNCEALTKVTHMVIDYMREGARILQFASSAAFMPQPGFAVYAASKAYVLSFSRALNAELKERDISVTAVCPGPVNTEFFEIAEKNGTNFHFKKAFMADKESVVRKAMTDAYHRKDMSVYSLSMNLFLILTKIVPHGLIMFLLKFFK